MRSRVTTLAVITAALVCVSLALVRAQAAAQGKQANARAATASAATPKLPDGHPDLSGQWYHRIGAPAPQIKPGQSYDAAVAKPVGINQFNPGRPVYKPEFVAKVKDYDERQVQVDPAWYCQPPGVPRIGPPQKIVQTTKEVVFLYDDLNGNFFRVVRLNAPHRTDIDPSAHGDSVGRWDGDTLVVDVTNLDDTTWLSDNGLFHSDKTHVIERLRREGDTLHYEVTVEDPAVFAEPWKQRPRDLKLMKDYEIEEAPYCSERDASHLQDLSHHGNLR
jgi:hypothetical protein